MIRAPHLKDMKKSTKELYRILKPGGIAVIEVANKRLSPKSFATGSKIRHQPLQSRAQHFERPQRSWLL